MGLVQMQEALGSTCPVRPTAVQTGMSSVLARASDISPSTKQEGTGRVPGSPVLDTALRLRPTTHLACGPGCDKGPFSASLHLRD